MIHQRLSILFVLVCLLMTGLVPVSANASALLLPAAVSEEITKLFLRLPALTQVQVRM